MEFIDEQKILDEIYNQHTNNQDPNHIYDDTLQQYNTLDEPVSETINLIIQLRDVRQIGYKLKHVLLPRFQEEKGAQLRNWDLWGPLFLSLSLTMVLTIKTTFNSSAVFSSIFGTIFIGAFVITLNARALGGKVSMFQSICVLGYCVFPILCAAIVNVLIGIYFSMKQKMYLTIIACVWSSIASTSFMGSLVPADKKFLALYPVLLFYIALSVFAVLH